jgi:formylglycine-generating enzyme required for sulfatase activity
VPFSAPVVGQRTSNSAGMDLVPFAGFWVSATETTLAQFARFAAATKLPELPMLSLTKHGRRDIGRTWRQPWISTNDGMTRPLTNDPVVGVSWSEAVAFCRWLTEHERARGIISARQAYALPSRAHWTAFAGSARFPWGNDTRLLRPDRRFLGNFAGLEVRKGLWAEQWFEGWSYLGGPIGADDFGPEEWGRYDDGFARTAPVGSFRRPDDDLADVAGNALEWGADPDPTQPGRRAVLGSCWFDDQLADLETAAVRWYPEELRDSRLGFRVLLIETTTP